MSGPLSADLRRRIIEAWKRKQLTSDELADLFGVGSATITRLKRLFRTSGSVEPRPHGGGPRRLIPVEQERLVAALVQSHPDWTEEEFATELHRQHGIRASAVTVGRVIRRLGYTVKKKRSSRRRETARRSKNDDETGAETSKGTPLRVWFSWTKPARTSR